MFFPKMACLSLTRVNNMVAEKSVLSWLCDVTLVERLRPLPPDIRANNELLKTMRTIEDKNIPSRRKQNLIQVQLIYSCTFVTMIKNTRNRIFLFLGLSLRDLRLPVFP